MPVSLPLSDITVVELGEELGTYAAKFLADAGATVVRVERPTGAAMRRYGPFLDDVPGIERSLYWAYYNTGKKSVVLDPDSEPDQRTLIELCTQSDVVIDGLGIRGLERGGALYDQISRNNPRLIYVSITPFGSEGPWSEYKASDLISLALGGPLFNCGYDDHEIPPIRGGGNQAYNTVSHLALIAINVALIWREKTGHGQFIDLSMHEACATTVEFSNLYYLYSGVLIGRQTGRHASVRSTQPTQHLCADGKYVNGTLRINDKKAWTSIKEFLADKGLLVDLGDPAYDDPDYRRENAGHIYEVLESLARLCTAEEYFHRAQSMGMVAGIIRAPEDLTVDPHLEERGFFLDVEPDGWGRSVRFPGPPYRATRWAREVGRPPLLGEHTVEVLSQLRQGDE